MSETRIAIDELARLILAARDAQVKEILQRCMNTIVEMDKDIAVYEHQIESMQRQHQAQMEADTP